MSVLKRKWGDAVSARKELAQHRQALLRGVAYNLHRLVQLGFCSLFRRSLAQSFDATP